MLEAMASLLPPERAVSVERQAAAMRQCNNGAVFSKNLLGRTVCEWANLCHSPDCPNCQISESRDRERAINHALRLIGAPFRMLHVMLTAGPNVFYTGEPCRDGSILNGTARHMTAGVTKFLKRAFGKSWLGHAWRLETTGSEHVGYHCHVHVLLLAKPDYFEGCHWADGKLVLGPKMVSKAKLSKRWASHMAKFNPHIGASVVAWITAGHDGTPAEALAGYMTKPSTYTHQDPEFLGGLWLGMHGRDKFGTAGVLREALRCAKAIEKSTRAVFTGDRYVFQPFGASWRLYAVIPAFVVDEAKLSGSVDWFGLADMCRRGPPPAPAPPVN